MNYVLVSYFTMYVYLVIRQRTSASNKLVVVVVVVKHADDQWRIQTFRLEGHEGRAPKAWPRAPPLGSAYADDNHYIN